MSPPSPSPPLWSSLIATGFGSGRLPVAPGTWGSALGLLIALGLFAQPYLPPLWALLGGAAIATAAGMIAVPPYLAASPSKDPSEVVIDEIAGQLLAAAPLALLPWPTLGWIGWALAFALFRLFDIFKPGPVAWADRQPGALGVMADDLIAGLLAALCLLAIGEPLNAL